MKPDAQASLLHPSEKGHAAASSTTSVLPEMMAALRATLSVHVAEDEETSRAAVARKLVRPDSVVQLGYSPGGGERAGRCEVGASWKGKSERDTTEEHPRICAKPANLRHASNKHSLQDDAKIRRGRGAWDAEEATATSSRH
eukprot:768706-Hanusia_phi.AAC.8